MNEIVSETDLERFAELLGCHMGLHFDDNRRGHLAKVLQNRLNQQRRSAAAYLTSLAAELQQDERAALARELTIGETYFFRNSEQFRALAEVALPDRLQANASTRRLRL